MAQFFLIASFVVRGTKRLPGDLIDDAVDDVTAMRAAGAYLWPSTDAAVAAAAARVAVVSRNRGSNEADLAAIMQAGVEQVQENQPVPSFTVATVAALRAVPNPLAKNFTIGFVQSNLGYYVWDAASTATDDGVLVAAPSAGTGRWLRSRWGHETHRSQAAWFVDPVGGSDEAGGLTSLTPLKTFRELAARMGGVITRPFSVTLMNNLPTTDPLDQLSLLSNWNTTLSPASPPSISVLGTRFVSRSSAFTAGSAVPVPASNLASQGVDTAVADWTADVGSLAAITSGASSGSVFWPLKNLGSNTVRASRFSTTNGVASAAPGAGDTYSIVTLTTAPPQLPTIYGHQSASSPIIIQDVSFTSSINFARNPTGFYQFQSCKFAGISGQGQHVFFAACLINGTVSSASGDSFFRASNSASLGTGANNTITINVGASAAVVDYVCQGCEFSGTDDATLSLTNLSVFDCTTANGGLWIQSSYAVLASALYGSGNTVGTRVNRMSRVFAAITPTLAGATELIFGNISTAFTVPTLSGSNLQSTSQSITTWAQWSSNFGKNAIDTTTGCMIIGT